MTATPLSEPTLAPRKRRSPTYRMSTLAAHAWRKNFFFRVVMTTIIASSFVWTLERVLAWLVPDPHRVWSVALLDKAVLVGIAGLLFAALILAALYLGWPASIRQKQFRSAVIRVGSSLVVVLTLYVAYATFRKQSRLTS